MYTYMYIHMSFAADATAATWGSAPLLHFSAHGF